LGKTGRRSKRIGCIQLNENNQIVDFVEKPKDFVSDLAIIGIYYFKSGETLRDELQYLLDNNVVKGGEYQLTDGLENMKVKGLKFVPGKVDEWMDCGNKNVTVETNSRMLGFLHNDGEHLVDYDVKLENATIIPPCYIGGRNFGQCHRCTECVAWQRLSRHRYHHQKQFGTEPFAYQNASLDNAMIGSHVNYNGQFTSVSIGDYSTLE
jgi:glucose-1-phosphate thymidylyltransferase